MKIAAYDEDGIWGVGDTAEKAIEEATGTLIDMDAADDIPNLKTAPISDELLEKISNADDPKMAAPIAEFPFILNADGVLVEDEPEEAEGEEEEDDDDDGEDDDDASTSVTPAATSDQAEIREPDQG
jgi:hypothetical protein